MCQQCDKAKEQLDKARDDRARVTHRYERVRQEYYAITDKCPDNN